MTTQNTMKAAVIDAFGGPEALRIQAIPVPVVTDNQILIRVDFAGVGKWDVFEREGLFAKMAPGKPTFPYILGSEGAGTIVETGKNVTQFHVGEVVYGIMPARNPKAGFYAEYVAVNSDKAWPMPRNLTLQQAAALALDGGTALRGIKDVLQLRKGSTIMIIGASGGIGHMAIQIAKRLGARVFAVVSGNDGVELALSFGADTAVDGKTVDVVAAAAVFAPKGMDTALVTTDSPGVAQMLQAVQKNGRIAYPYGVRLNPDERLIGYNANYDDTLMEQLNHIAADDFTVHIDQIFSLADTSTAHKSLYKHHIGRMILSTRLPG